MLSMDHNFAFTVNHKENMPLHESRATFGIYAMAAIVVEDKLIIIIAVATPRWPDRDLLPRLDVAVVLFVSRFVAFSSTLVEITLYMPVYMTNVVSVLARCGLVGFTGTYKMNAARFVHAQSDHRVHLTVNLLVNVPRFLIQRLGFVVFPLRI